MATLARILAVLGGLLGRLWAEFSGRAGWERELKRLQEQLDEVSKQYLGAVSRGDPGLEWRLRIEQTDIAVALARHRERGKRAGYIRGTQ